MSGGSCRSMFARCCRMLESALRLQMVCRFWPLGSRICSALWPTGEPMPHWSIAALGTSPRPLDGSPASWAMVQTFRGSDCGQTTSGRSSKARGAPEAFSSTTWPVAFAWKKGTQGVPMARCSCEDMKSQAVVLRPPASASALLSRSHSFWWRSLILSTRSSAACACSAVNWCALPKARMSSFLSSA